MAAAEPLGFNPSWPQHGRGRGSRLNHRSTEGANHRRSAAASRRRGRGPTVAESLAEATLPGTTASPRRRDPRERRGGEGTVRRTR
uniref:Uncharacterized protein n=1 Tax=Arundo donax TaxID=35708 RepID=A0A0A8XSF8_ARUDO